MIIGLTGYARSGKDTVADYLCAKHGFKKMAFADPIKESLLRLNPMVAGSMRVKTIIEATGWEQAKDDYPEVRQLLQRFGTEVGRELYGPNFWIRLMEHRIKNATADRIVIPDVRFPNEAQSIKDMPGSQIWRIKRPLFQPANSHTSESAMDDWKADQIFANSASLKDLEALVKTRMMQYV